MYTLLRIALAPFGGTWSQLKNRFLVGAGDTYAAEETGGEATHTLTIKEMAPHSHRLMMGWGSNPSVWNTLAGEVGAGSRWGSNSAACDGLKMFDGTDAVQGGAAHNNLPPYYAVYMWVRTA